MKKLLLILALACPVFAEEPPKETPKKESFIQEHRPVFILFGNNSMNTLLQVSMKYEMWKNSNLYIAYTQTSMWALFQLQNSSPFIDHNFNPEIFYRVTQLEKYDFTADIGQEHKSNGRESGPYDRTSDSTYISAEKGFSVGGLRLGWYNKVFAVYRTFGNDDLKDYMGYWKTGLTLGFDVPWLDNEQLFANFTPGISADLSKSTVEAGAKFRTPFGQDFAPYIMVQYWRGYNAMLINYSTFAEGVRVGIVLYR